MTSKKKKEDLFLLNIEQQDFFPPVPFFNFFLFLFCFLFWQEHLEALEVEKQELGNQIDHIVMENRGLLQLKMSLGLEVATYRYTELPAALSFLKHR